MKEILTEFLYSFSVVFVCTTIGTVILCYAIETIKKLK